MLRNAWPSILASLLLLGLNSAARAQNYTQDGCRGPSKDGVTQKWVDVPGPLGSPQRSETAQVQAHEQASAQAAELRCRLGLVMDELEKVKQHNQALLAIFRELEEERKRKDAIAQSTAAMRQELDAALERQHSEALQQEKQRNSELAQELWAARQELLAHELWAARQKLEAADQRGTKANGEAASTSLAPAAKPEAIRGKEQLAKQASEPTPISDRAGPARETTRRVAGKRADRDALSSQLQMTKGQESGSDAGKELGSSSVRVSSSTRQKVTGVHPAHVRAPDGRPAEETQKERRGRETTRAPKVQYAQSLNRDTRPAGGLRKMVGLVPELPVELRP
jgi:hypothetical protein